MKKLYYYFHAGSANHGCEAIVRSTSALLGVRPKIFSDGCDEDERYGVNKIADLCSHGSYEYSNMEKICCKITSGILGNEAYGYSLLSKYESREFETPAVALSIGGDNYCYGKAYDLHLEGLNRHLHKNGIKTVLWGCSIEPSTVTERMRADLGRYDLIVARESISYDFLKRCNPNTLIACDPAFTLRTETPSEHLAFFEKGNTVGINISPLIQKHERKLGITLDNYIFTIRYILENTDRNIALIPHVVSPGNDDRKPLGELFEMFKSTGRVCLIEDCNCSSLKGYISRCDLFIGARTHATIAAYSSYVPTLVIGYSTKAIGIATDLFGTFLNYVLPVQSLENEGDMAEAFVWLEKNSADIRRHLKNRIPGYTETVLKAANAVKELL